MEQIEQPLLAALEQLKCVSVVLMVQLQRSVAHLERLRQLQTLKDALEPLRPRKMDMFTLTALVPEFRSVSKRFSWLDKAC